MGMTFPMPQPSTILPPAVGPVSNAGTPDPLKYANADHTHQSSIQAARIAITVGSVVRWTFPIPFDVAPNVVPGCENVSGATQGFIANIVGQPTTTYVDIQVFQTQSTTLGNALANLLGAIIAPLKPAPVGTVVQLLARKPTVLPP